MRLSRHATVWVAASTLLMAGLAGCSSDDSPGAGGTIVIGADLNNSSAVDTAYARALQLRIDQINTSGQLGRRKLELGQCGRCRQESAVAGDLVKGLAAGEADVVDAVAGGIQQPQTQAEVRSVDEGCDGPVDQGRRPVAVAQG